MKIWHALVLAGALTIAWSQAGPPFPDARASDPVALGWMQGSPATCRNSSKAALATPPWSRSWT